jgi:hypothetical protein
MMKLGPWRASPSLIVQHGDFRNFHRASWWNFSRKISPSNPAAYFGHCYAKAFRRNLLREKDAQTKLCAT